jgi:hypothetical protein
MKNCFRFDISHLVAQFSEFNPKKIGQILICLYKRIETMKIDLSTILNGVSIVILGITAIVMYFTLKESRKLRMDGQMPLICFRWKIGPVDFSNPTPVFSYRIINVGAGPAIIEKFIWNRVEKTTEIDNIIGNKVDPDWEICFAFEPVKNQQEQDMTPMLKKKDMTLSIVYKDVFGRKYETKFEKCRNIFGRLDC